MNKKRVYIAGRMRSVPWFNFPAFDAARDRLAELGLEPLSPADMDRLNGFDPSEMDADSVWSVTPLGFDLAAAIARGNAAIDDSNTVAVYVITDGFADSEGATAEVERGMKAGKIILFDTMSDERILRAVGMPVTVDDHVAALTREVHAAMGIPAGFLGKEEIRYTDPMTGGGVLDEAKNLICGERNHTYGPPADDFQRTADMMNGLFGWMLKDGCRFKSRDVAWIMMMVKASRSQHSPKRDNYVDAAGYAACGWECECSENTKYAKGETKA